MTAQAKEPSALYGHVLSRDMVATHAYLISRMLECLIEAERASAKVAEQEAFLAQRAAHLEASRGAGTADPQTLADMRDTYQKNDPTWRELTGTHAYWDRQVQSYAAAAKAVQGSIDLKMRRIGR